MPQEFRLLPRPRNNELCLRLRFFPLNSRLLQYSGAFPGFLWTLLSRILTMAFINYSNQARTSVSTKQPNASNQVICSLVSTLNFGQQEFQDRLHSKLLIEFFRFTAAYLSDTFIPLQSPQRNCKDRFHSLQVNQILTFHYCLLTRLRFPFSLLIATVFKEH